MRSTDHKSTLQFTRYLIVGAFNTVFGYSVFALLNWSFAALGPYSYMYAWALANLIAITEAFLAYKWFVFRTRGKYIAEWVRCLGVYGSTMLIGIVTLPILVSMLRRTLHRPEQAPYIAVALGTLLTVLLSFFGHKNISFRQSAT